MRDEAKMIVLDGLDGERKRMIDFVIRGGDLRDPDKRR